MYRKVPKKWKLLRFLVVIVTWFLLTGGLPHQSADWFAMTGNLKAKLFKQQFINLPGCADTCLTAAYSTLRFLHWIESNACILPQNRIY